MRTVQLAAVVLLGSSMSLSAATFQGTFWDAPANEFNPSGAEIGDPNGGGLQKAIDYANNNAATATFTSTSLDYGNAGSNWVIGSLSDFLNADAGSIVGTNTANIQESVFRFQGKSYFEDGQDYTVTSDDGFRLVADNMSIFEYGGNRPPNQSSTYTWDKGTGVYDVTLWFYEGNFTQVRLTSNIAPVPLPASGLMVLASLAGLGAVARTRKS